MTRAPLAVLPFATEGGLEVQWWSMIPFIVMLLSIAILPLIHATEHRWEQNSTKLTLALILGIPVAVWFWFAGEHTTVLHSLWEYVQFVLLLGSLFIVSGGIFLTGDLRATPRTNATFLGVGAVLASFIGTTGAAMLLVRPLLNTNKERLHKVHTIVFLIFIAANTGGLLTPLGDPPLFLGFLRGVPFTWTFNLLPEWLFVNAMLLATYFALDTRLYRKEPGSALLSDAIQRTPLGVKGKIHFLFLALVVVAVALIPSLDLHAIETGEATLTQMIPWRELVFVLAGAGSYFLGDKVARFVSNEFSWTPILEVAALFIGIFLTMMPALKFLSQIAPELPLNELTFFAFTGGLSAVLDNAPTYVTFFEMARQLPGEPRVADVPEVYLVSISLGAVFMGAMTYIGNGPNFMTKAVADSRGVAMPSFGGYVVWSGRDLLPILIAMALIFIAPQLWLKIIGILLAVLILARAALVLRSTREAEVVEERPLDEATV